MSALSKQHTSNTLAMLVIAAWTFFGLAPSLALAAGDDSRASVSIDTEIVEVGGTFEYTINAATNGNSNIRLVKEPDFRPFAVVGRSQMPQFIVRNGQAQRSLTILYRLRTRRIGDFDISPPVIEIGGEKLTPKSVKLKVVKEGEAPRKQGPSKTDAAYIDVDLEPKRNPYVGEQVVLEYNLFMDSRQIDGQPHPPTEPSLDAFWIEDLSGKTAGTKQLVRLGSRFFEKVQLRKYALFPLRAGPATIDPMKVDIVTGGFLTRQRTFNISSDTIKLDVQPLPPDAPKGFYEGNVGDWNFLVTTDLRETRVGRAVTIKVIARGDGQPGRLQLPDLPEIEGTKLANSEERSDSKMRGDRVVGEKTHSYALTPLKEGALTIPSLSFSYFDPEAGEYRTKESAPITIKVGAGTLPEEVEDLPEPEARRSGSTEDDLLASLRSEMSKPRRDISYGTRRHILEPGSLAYMILAGLPLAILFLLGATPLLGRFVRRETPGKKRKQAVREVRAQLEEARSAGERGWDLVMGAIKSYATDVLGLSSGHVTERELPARAQKVGVPEELARELGELLGECNRARFSPTAKSQDAAREALVERASKAIDELESLRKKKKLSLDGVAHLAVLVGASLLLFVAGAALAPSDAHASDALNKAKGVSARALEAQDARKWDEAIALWEEVDALTPNEPDVLYNLGTCAMQAGELARARLALERALLHDPQGRDIANNLDLVTRMIRVRTIERVRGRSARVGVSDDFFFWDIARRVTARALSLLLLVSLWILLVAVLARPRVRQPGVRDTLMILIVLAAVLAVCSGAGWIAREQIMRQVHPAIVMAEEPALREGPSEHAASLGAAHPVASGMRVPIEETRQGWSKIRLPDGTSGWVHADDLSRIR